MQHFLERELPFFKSILLLFFDCNSNYVSMSHEQRVNFYIYFPVRHYTPTICIAPAWAKWINRSQSYSQLEKYSNVLSKTDRIWKAFLVTLSVKHKSVFIQRRKYIWIYTLPLPQMSHLTNEEYVGSKTIFCLLVDMTAIARLTCMTLWLRMKKYECRPTPWENKNSPSCQIRNPGSQVSAFAQRAGPLAVAGEYEEDESTQSLLQSPRPRPQLSCWAAADGFSFTKDGFCLTAAFQRQLNLWCLQPPMAIISSVIMHCMKGSTSCYCFSEAYLRYLNSSIITAELVKILSLFHIGLSSLWGCSLIPLEVRQKLLLGL